MGSDNELVVELPPLRARHVIALTAGALFLVGGIASSILFAFHHVYPSVIWIVFAMFVLPAAFFFRLAYPPRKSWPRFCVCKESIRYIPGRVQRFAGEPVHETAISPHASEIIFCRCLLEGLTGEYRSDGYRIVVTSRGIAEHELSLGLGTAFDVERCGDIADGITAGTGLSVRLVLRKQPLSGPVTEVPWVPAARKASLKGPTALLLGFLPYIGGIAVGYLTMRPLLIVIAGLALWIAQLLAISAFGKRKWRSVMTPYGLSTIFTFSAGYAATVAFVIFVLRSH